jgi:hypothetical protein
MEHVEAEPVAKKKRSGSESRRFNTLVRMDDDLCAKARKLAVLRGISMAKMFADVLRPWIDREWAKEVRKLKEEEGSG